MTPIKTLALVIAAAVLAACADAQPKKTAAAPALTARCNIDPQWRTEDDHGQKLGIYVCFGDENRLLYEVRVLPPAAAVPAVKDIR